MTQLIFKIEKDIIGLLLTDPKSSFQTVKAYEYLLQEPKFFYNDTHKKGRIIFEYIVNKDFEKARKIYVPGIDINDINYSNERLEYLLETYSSELRKEKLRDDLISKLRSSNEVVFEDMVGDLSQIIEKYKKEIKDSFEIKTLGDHMDEYREIIKNRRDKKRQAFVYSTGYSALDDILSGGLEKGRLITIASGTAMGKTTFALNLAKQIIQNNKKVLFFSMEMNPYQIIDRLICIKSGIDNRKLRTHNLSSHEIEKMDKAITWLEKKSFYIDETRILENLVSKVRKKITENELDVLFVDYIQLMKTLSADRKNINRTLEIGEITGTLKSIALTYNIPVVQISQVDRNITKPQKNKITLSDLSWSASLEQDSDVVIFIQKDLSGNDNTNIDIMGITDDNNLIDNNLIETGINEDIDNNSKYDVIIEVAKNRDGARGEIPFYFNAPTYTFEQK